MRREQAAALAWGVGLVLAAILATLTAMAIAGGVGYVTASVLP